jgi:hypothetical protein
MNLAGPSLPCDPEPPEVRNRLGAAPGFRYSGIQEGSTMPLRDHFRSPLADNLAIPLELEGSYEETCGVLRIL